MTRITIADDSMLSRKALRKALPPEWEVDISEACNGKEALEAVEDGRAEVLFLDLTMPELDGFEVLKFLHDVHSKTVVIVVSADIQPEARKLVDQYGAFRFLQKPANAEVLRETLFDMGLI